MEIIEWGETAHFPIRLVVGRGKGESEKIERMKGWNMERYHWDKGNYTFVSNMGSSVIDLALVSRGLLRSIKKMEIIEWGETAHFPIMIEVGRGKGETGKIERMKGLNMERYSWDENKKENFMTYFQSKEYEREMDELERVFREEGEEKGVVGRVNQILKGALKEMREKEKEKYREGGAGSQRDVGGRGKK